MRSSGRNSGSGSGGQGGRPGGQGGGGRGQGGRSGGGSFRQGQGGGQGGRSGGPGGGGRGGSGQGGRPGGQGGRSGGPGGRQGFQGGRDEQDQRPRRPRPEERRYDVGNDAPGARDGQDGPRKGRGAAARGGAKGGPKPAQGGGPRGGGFRRGGAPSRPRELDAKIEQRNRDRYANKPDIKLPKTHPGAEEEGERLQKVLARAGMGSRRACEELIDQARVEVNGEIVVEQGMRVDVHKDEIKVDGLTVAAQSYLFFALNKPAGVVSSMEDPDGRQCLGDYVTNRETRLFHVGRLDTETEGIIMLTNHGELAHRLTHPKYGVKKTYLAAIQGPLPRDLGKRLKDGIQLEDGYARADHFRVVENTGKNYLVEVTLHEGRKHIVRRMLAEAGFPVERLVRTSFGPIPLGDQKSGWLRRLTNTEVGMLMREVGL
ncbi:MULTISPECIES: pseudouridine synthase [Streptomyces]|uniref:Pseudouridine synthase n=1 Tax=Streptomyces violaceoruber TaxID=1935 RepID=A0A1V0U7Q4_STRVN|nr:MULTISPECIES: pseudouridine synthase [Streptomyces]ARF60972.1 pseudouridine synthase [Streptomyces violaceoruber]KOG77143.1 pseudouridine synthase [Streptomyces griseus subsp. rhodochrous]KOU50008.1 pseudouridine synthase [Streptomyces sp. MMG1522]MBD3552979.1 rRNA pseudouridine synthase [Streptomyces sp. SP18CM02]MCC0579106.1 rRNA pseudouridine synthase [Streptomyces californicus]